jgi:plastocyanin
MNRRDFLRTASGVSAGAAAATAAGTPAAADEAPASTTSFQADNESGDGNESGGGNESESGGGGETHEVVVGPGGETVFDPDSLTIAPGDTVHWVWDSDTHNIAPQNTPDGAEWEGHTEIADAGTEYEHTFETEGAYEYICEPHVAAGMEGTIQVGGSGGGGGGEGAAASFDPEHIGVPIQKHFIGAATFTAIFATMGFIFYLLKYGESANTSYPNKKD